MMPTALQLVADGPPVEISIGRRALGPMSLTNVSCPGPCYDVAVLVFKPATGSEGRSR